MTEKGLEEVPNPSELFITDRKNNVSGTIVFAGIEGTRPLLVEIQALVAPTNFSSPKRTTVGWDFAKLSMMTAVLEARCGLPISSNDVYLNVASGLKITEPAADLAVALAILSSFKKEALPSKTIAFGEIGLTGEVRSVGHINNRLKEASKLGFEQAIIPALTAKQKDFRDLNIKLIEIEKVQQLLGLFSSNSYKRS